MMVFTLALALREISQVYFLLLELCLTEITACKFSC